MASSLRTIGGQVAWYGFGTFMFFVYWSISVATGSFFQRESEKERLELAIARDRVWNLSKQFEGLTHKFFTLRTGQKLHYVTNNPDGTGGVKPLLILLHGYPDSYAVWRFIFQSKNLKEDSNIVAVDLPGYGGSDSFQTYSATTVLEALAEFIIGVRELYTPLNDTDSGHGSSGENNADMPKVYIAGHDWGCVLLYRLAAEAPALADRFFMTNGPNAHLTRANIERITSFSGKMFNTFYKAPLKSRQYLFKALRSLLPLAHQMYLFGYIPAFHLPAILVKYLLSGGNRAFFRGVHQFAAGPKNPQLSQANHLAAILGPSLEECQTQNNVSNGDKSGSYPSSVFHRVMQNRGPYEATEYYRTQIAIGKWDKSLETVAGLHDIEVSSGTLKPRRQSSGALLFGERHEGTLRAPSTIIWGQRDHVLTQKICLDGIGDYLAKGSQVIMLPRTGHWTPSEVEGREALKTVLEWGIQGGKIEILEETVKNVYPGAFISVRQ